MGQKSVAVKDRRSSLAADTMSSVCSRALSRPPSGSWAKRDGARDAAIDEYPGEFPVLFEGPARDPALLLFEADACSARRSLG